MSRQNMKMPDGSVVPVDLPDGATTAQINAFLNSPDFAAAVKTASGPRPQAAAQSDPSLLEKTGDVARTVATAISPVNIAAGQVKGAVDTVYNIGRGVVNVAQDRPADTPRNPRFEAALQPSNTGEKVGKFVERGAEFAVGGEAAGAVKSVPLLARGTGLLGRIVRGAAGATAEATAGAAVTKAQGGTNTEAAVAAGIGGLLGPVLEAGGGGVKWLGEKLQARQIAASAADDAAGFSVDTLNRYGLSKMTMGRTLTAVHEKIVGLADQLRAITKNTPGEIDLHAVWGDVKNELLSRSGLVKNAGSIESIQNAIQKLEGEAQSLGGHVSLDEAQTLKRAVGVKGAWAYGKTDADTAMETVANTYTKFLRQYIEDSTPSGAVKAINDQLGELMPIERAIIRRMPVKARQGDLDLKDIALLATGHPVLAAAHVVANSMAGATAAYASGKGLQGAARAIVRGAQATVSSMGGGAGDGTNP